LFLATSPIAVRDAHYIKLDVPVTMFTALALVMLARVVLDPDAASRSRVWLIAGLTAGLAMSTQYYVVFLALGLAVAALAEWQRTRHVQGALAKLAWAAGGATAGFVLGTPFFFLELDTAMRDIAGVREVDIDRALAGGGGLFASLPAYLHMLSVDAMGWPVAAAALVGTVWIAWGDRRRAIVLLAFPLAYLIFIAHTVPMSRYVNCVLPPMAVLGAHGLVQVARRVARSPAVPTLCLALAACAPAAWASVQIGRFFNQADTRTLARDFIEREVPPGSSVLVQPYSAPIHRSRDSLIEALRANLGSERHAPIKFQLELAVRPGLQPTYRTIYYGDGGRDADKVYVLPSEFVGSNGLGPLRERNIEYVVLKRANTANPEIAALEAALARDAERLATFSPYRPTVSPAEQALVAPFLHHVAIRVDPALERPGPIVDIWRLN
jgi:hypothetical protein